MLKLKSLSARFAWILAVCLLAASPALAQSERGLDRVMKTGELRVGVSGEQPPLNMTARNGELIGMEIALMRVLGQSMGANVVFVKMPFGDLLGALDDQKVDLVMSGMTITPERIQRAAFVGPYFTSGKTVLTKSEKLAAASIPQELEDQKPKMVALAGSTSETCARASLSKADLEVTVTLEEAIAKVLRGTTDLLVADRETCTFAALRHEGQGLIVSDATFTVEPMGIAVPLDQPRFADLLEHYLAALRDSGALDRARDFWFEDSSWIASLR
jgi:polar amino acid transport system substrate-binding protein